MANNVGEEATDRPFIAELHLALGRVNVDIDPAWIDFEKEATDRVAAFHEARVIPLEEGVLETAVVDRAAVDEKVLVLAGGA